MAAYTTPIDSHSSGGWRLKKVLAGFVSAEDPLPGHSMVTAMDEAGVHGKWWPVACESNRKAFTLQALGLGLTSHRDGPRQQTHTRQDFWVYMGTALGKGL